VRCFVELGRVVVVKRGKAAGRRSFPRLRPEVFKSPAWKSLIGQFASALGSEDKYEAARLLNSLRERQPPMPPTPAAAGTPPP
jgi:hypothetical protein